MPVEVPNDKHRKNEQGAASTTDTTGKAAAPELPPAVAKKPSKAQNLCACDSKTDIRIMGAAASASIRLIDRVANVKNVAAAASASTSSRGATVHNVAAAASAEHQRQRIKCKQRGSSSICEHQKERSKCKECGGSSGICKHQGRRSKC